jgi:hypothetical protein
MANLIIKNNLISFKQKFNSILIRYMQQEPIRKPSVVSNNKQIDKQSTSESNVQSTAQSSVKSKPIDKENTPNTSNQTTGNTTAETSTVTTTHITNEAIIYDYVQAVSRPNKNINRIQILMMRETMRLFAQLMIKVGRKLI